MIFFLIVMTALAKNSVVVSSKTFTESYILAEIISQRIDEIGEVNVERKFGLGGTGIVFRSLKSGDTDFYIEYTGTLQEAIYKDLKKKSWEALRSRLQQEYLEISRPLGLNNTYAMALSPISYAKNPMEDISELRNYPKLRMGLTHEFLKRADGWEALKAAYKLPQSDIRGMVHSLSYEAIARGQIDVMEVYSTDAKIQKLNLKILKDDLNFFPIYNAVILTRKDVIRKYPQTWAGLQDLAGKITNKKMRELNAQVEFEGKSFADAALYFFTGESKKEIPKGEKSELLRLTREHILLVFISVLGAIILGVPMGIVAHKRPNLGQFLHASVGILQSIPSLALLCFTIPLMGIGFVPAVFAIFIYALLPIIRSTHAGMDSVDKKLIETARAMGLNTKQILLKIQLPLSYRTLLAGIKTSSIIAVGNATLAAFIGAGGYGEPIVTGLALNDLSLIFRGAIPASALAIVLHVIFEVVDKACIPRSLR